MSIKSHPLKNWNVIEIIFLIIGLLTNTVLALIYRYSTISIIYAYTSVVSAMLLIKRNVFGYAIAIVSSILCICLSAQEHFFSEVITNSLALLVDSAGLLIWHRKDKNEKGEVNISLVHRDEVAMVFISQLFLLYPYYLLLKAFDKELIYISVFCLSLGLVSHYFLARSSALSYSLFICKDLLVMILWFYALIVKGSPNFGGLLVTIFYFFSDIYGAIKWKRDKEALLRELNG
ncbi:MAG: nicotinamide mononucleotide transporter [Erysipelotrichaceae bacterium]|nr:nicotinamide mononucleotide transporter [Erysipelotrichaceae bacterium]